MTDQKKTWKQVMRLNIKDKTTKEYTDILNIIEDQDGNLVPVWNKELTDEQVRALLSTRSKEGSTHFFNAQRPRPKDSVRTPSY